MREGRGLVVGDDDDHVRFLPCPPPRYRDSLSIYIYTWHRCYVGGWHSLPCFSEAGEREWVSERALVPCSVLGELGQVPVRRPFSSVVSGLDGPRGNSGSKGLMGVIRCFQFRGQCGALFNHGSKGLKVMSFQLPVHDVALVQFVGLWSEELKARCVSLLSLLRQMGNAEVIPIMGL